MFTQITCILSTFSNYKLFFPAVVEFSWPANKWIKGNFKQVGYYRVHYDDDNWKDLIKQLNDDHNVSTAVCMYTYCLVQFTHYELADCPSVLLVILI